MDVFGLMLQLVLCSVVLVSFEDLWWIYFDSYLECFKVISDNGGGMFGKEVLLGLGSYEIVCFFVGLVCVVVEVVLKGELDNVYLLLCLFGYYCLLDQLMGFCFFVNIFIVVE